MKLNTISVSILAATMITISGISALETITNAVVQEEGDWKTYISPDYKFSIEYPSGLDVKYGHSGFSNAQQIAFITFDFENNLDSYVISITPNDMNLLDYIEKYSHLYEGEKIQTLEKPAPITIAGNSGYSYSVLSSDGSILRKAVVFIHGDHIFDFQVTASTDSFDESRYKHMIESIKFLDQ